MDKYLYRFLCTIIMVFIAMGSFAWVWINFVSIHNQTGHLMGKGNLLMSILLYGALFLIIGK